MRDNQIDAPIKEEEEEEVFDEAEDSDEEAAGKNSEDSDEEVEPLCYICEEGAAEGDEMVCCPFCDDCPKEWLSPQLSRCRQIGNGRGRVGVHGMPRRVGFSLPLQNFHTWKFSPATNL